MEIYDHNFNLNEIFVLTLILAGYFITLLPRRFSKKITLLILLYGPVVGTLFDNLMGIQLINLYDINDTSNYTGYDALLYLGYGPVSYLFIYFYDKYLNSKLATVFYILVWSFIAVLVEYITAVIGVFHYKNGYETFYSFPIYLLVQFGLVSFFHLCLKLERADEKTKCF